MSEQLEGYASIVQRRHNAIFDIYVTLLCLQCQKIVPCQEGIDTVQTIERRLREEVGVTRVMGTDPQIQGKNLFWFLFL